MPSHLPSLLITCLLAGCVATPAQALAPVAQVTTLTPRPQRSAAGTPIPLPFKLALGTGALTLVWLGTTKVWQCSASASEDVAFAALEPGTYEALGYAEVMARLDNTAPPADPVIAGSRQGTAVLVARKGKDAAKILVEPDRIVVTSWSAAP